MSTPRSRVTRLSKIIVTTYGFASRRVLPDVRNPGPRTMRTCAGRLRSPRPTEYLAGWQPPSTAAGEMAMTLARQIQPIASTDDEIRTALLDADLPSLL